MINHQRLYACVVPSTSPSFTYPFCHMSSWCKEAQPATDGLQLTKFDLVWYNGCLVLMLKEYFTFCNFRCSDYTEWMLPDSIFVLEILLIFSCTNCSSSVFLLKALYCPVSFCPYLFPVIFSVNLGPAHLCVLHVYAHAFDAAGLWNASAQ